MRHAPPEPELRKVLQQLATDRPKVFNAYQQSQRPQEEKKLLKAKYLASFIGHKPGQALFIGLYRLRGHWEVSRDEFWRIAENRELRKYGMTGPSRPSCLWFDLKEEERFSDWKGKLVVRWGHPGRCERSWARWAADNEFAIVLAAQEIVAEQDPSEEDERDNAMIENLTVMRHHKRLERDPSVSAKVKRALGHQCQACGFCFEKMYPGIRDSKYIEAHHLIPAWTLKGKEVVHKDLKADFAVLCANCHRMIHRFESPGDLAAFRAVISKLQ
jgi:hypothetical protein